ncbi:MAG TPA: hypothetical protein VGN72_15820 [Tepidisphaeraceae bacterium]|jgi:hypothetical protein|nr:hypothetical protein [Tepidisphaeraceae bacterium]
MWNEHANGDSAVADHDLQTDAQLLGGLRDAYHGQGYQQGYIRGSRDASAMLVLAVEEFIRARALDTAERAMLRQFHRYTERHLDALSPAFTDVEGGLGI